MMMDVYMMHDMWNVMCMVISLSSFFFLSTTYSSAFMEKRVD